MPEYACYPECRCGGTGQVESGPSGATYSYPCYPWDCRNAECRCHGTATLGDRLAIVLPQALWERDPDYDGRKFWQIPRERQDAFRSDADLLWLRLVELARPLVCDPDTRKEPQDG